MFLFVLFISVFPQESVQFETYRNTIDYNENFNRDRSDSLRQEDDVVIKESDSEDYSDYAPIAMAFIGVDVLEAEEKKGPSLGRVLG